MRAICANLLVGRATGEGSGTNAAVAVRFSIACDVRIASKQPTGDESSRWSVSAGTADNRTADNRNADNRNADNRTAVGDTGSTE